MEALSAKLADAVKAQLKKAEGKLYAAKQQVEDGERRCPTPNARRRTA